MTFAPATGPVGSTVQVHAENLPAVTPVRLGIGGVWSGFEELEQLMTTASGGIATSITIPEWATLDRTHSFVVFDLYFRPLAISEAFYVTREDGLVLRRGTVLEPAERCGALLGDDGERYALVGVTEPFHEGDAVVVMGLVTSVAICGSTPAIDVRRIERSSVER